MKNKTMKTVKILTITFLVILISMISFVGIYQKNKNRMENKVKDYSYSMSLNGARTIKLKVNTESTNDVPNNSEEALTSENYEKSKEIEETLTQKIFGISYEDLSQLIYHFNNCFKITTQTYYNRYPSITRAIKNDNYCDITEMWIPAGFPYIAFSESGYYYSHISLYGFYQQVKFITLNYIESSVSKKLIEDGLNPKVLENLFKIEKDYRSIPIDYNLQRELENK